MWLANLSGAACTDIIKLKLAKIPLIILTVFLFIVEIAMMRYGATTLPTDNLSYFDLVYFMTSDPPCFVLNVCSLIFIYVCFYINSHYYLESMLYRYQTRRHIWLSQCRFQIILAIPVSFLFAVFSLIDSFFYTQKASNFYENTSIMWKMVQQSDGAKSPPDFNYLFVFLLCMLCVFLCFSTMSIIFQFVFWQTNHVLIAYLAVLAVNLFDYPEKFPLFYSFNNIGYSYFIDGSILFRFSVAIAWLIIFILLGCIFSKRKGFLYGKH